MQQGSLIRSARKRGPDVWQFRWADRGPYGKRIYRKRVGAGNFAQIYSSGRTTRGNPEAIRMAYFPAHLLDVAAECRDRVQGDARVVAAFVLAVYVGHLQ